MEKEEVKVAKTETATTQSKNAKRSAKRRYNKANAQKEVTASAVCAHIADIEPATQLAKDIATETKQTEIYVRIMGYTGVWEAIVGQTKKYYTLVKEVIVSLFKRK